MSGFEIERKFLIREGGNYKDAAFSCSRIKTTVLMEFQAQL